MKFPTLFSEKVENLIRQNAASDLGLYCLHVSQKGLGLYGLTCLFADPGVASLIPDRFHTFVEIDHEIICTIIILPSADSRRVVINYKRKYVHKVLVNLPRKKCG